MTPQEKIEQLRRTAVHYQQQANESPAKGYALLYERWAKKATAKADEIERWLKTPAHLRGDLPRA